MGHVASIIPQGCGCGGRAGPGSRLEARVAALGEPATGFLQLVLEWEIGVTPRLHAGEHLKVHFGNIHGEVQGQWCGKPDKEEGFAEVSRRYTPTASSGNSHTLLVELVSKVRAPPDGGKFSRFMQGLGVGAKVTVTGPHGVYRYLGGGVFERRGGAFGQLEEVRATDVAVVAAGVAANTALNLARAMVRDGAGGPRVWLVLAARSSETVLHRDALEELVTEAAGRLSLWYTIERSGASPDWPYSTGDLGQALTEEHLPPLGESTLFIAAGSPKTRSACEVRLAALGRQRAGPSRTKLWLWNEELDE